MGLYHVINFQLPVFILWHVWQRWRHRCVNRKQRQWSMVINGLHNDVTDDRDGCYTTGADGMKTGSWRQSRRSANGGGSSGSSMIAGGRGPGAEICDGSGRRPYMTADDEWTCRRVLLSASAVPHTCGEDDNTVSQMLQEHK